MPPENCADFFVDDFESGNLSLWNVYGAAPIVTDQMPLEGRYSLLSTEGAPNAVYSFFSPRSDVALSYSLASSGLNPTMVVPASVYMGNVNGDLVFGYVSQGPSGDLIVTFYVRDAGMVSDSGVVSLTQGTHLRIHWKGAKGGSNGFVRVYTDGVLRWQSSAVRHPDDVASEIRLGTQGLGGAGALKLDSVTLAECQ